MTRPPVTTVVQEAGYETGAVVAAPYLTEGNGYAKGVDRFWSPYRLQGRCLHRLEHIARIAVNHPCAPAATVNEQVCRFLDNADTDRPFFLWTHYMDAHAPYTGFDTSVFGTAHSPRRLQYLARKAWHVPSRVTDDERRILLDAYDNCLRTLDEAVEALFDELALRNLRASTVVLITADHGELFGEYGAYGHGPVVNEVLLVPLLVVDPTVPAPMTVSDPLWTLGIPATIGALTGVSVSTDEPSLYDHVPSRAVQTGTDTPIETNDAAADAD